jgi:hypothetical protein
MPTFLAVRFDGFVDLVGRKPPLNVDRARGSGWPGVHNPAKVTGIELGHKLALWKLKLRCVRLVGCALQGGLEPDVAGAELAKYPCGVKGGDALAS